MILSLDTEAEDFATVGTEGTASQTIQSSVKVPDTGMRGMSYLGKLLSWFERMSLMREMRTRKSVIGMRGKVDPKKAIRNMMAAEWIHLGEDWDCPVSQKGWSTPDLQPLNQM